MAVVTPSFAPDFELCFDLHQSVLAYSPESVHHHIVVPRRDLDLFARLGGPRAAIHCIADFLPRSFLAIPPVNAWVNLRRPVPPIRGWITQQVVKLAAAAQLDADVVLLVDSDIRFVRPFTPQTYVRDGVVRFYRKPDEIDQRLPRHMIWHQSARALLGLPPASPPFTDYVSCPNAWDPAVVTKLLSHLQEVSGRRWQDSIGIQLHFSEMTLYGVFVDEVLGAPANSFASADMLCHNHYDETPLDERGIAEFLGDTRPTDVAVMISAKSRTPLAVRRAAFAALPPDQASPAAEPPSMR